MCNAPDKVAMTSLSRSNDIMLIEQIYLHCTKMNQNFDINGMNEGFPAPNSRQHAAFN